MSHRYSIDGERIDEEPADTWDPFNATPGDALPHAYRHFLEPRTEEGTRAGIAECRAALAAARRLRRVDHAPNETQLQELHGLQLSEGAA